MPTSSTLSPSTRCYSELTLSDRTTPVQATEDHTSTLRGSNACPINATNAPRSPLSVQFVSVATIPKTFPQHRSDLAWLYLKGVSTGDFSEALTSLLL